MAVKVYLGAAARPPESTTAVELHGALLSSDDYTAGDYWKDVPGGSIIDLLASSPEKLVYAESPEAVESQLRARYPSPSGTDRLLRYQKGWLCLHHPYLLCDVTNLAPAESLAGVVLDWLKVSRGPLFVRRYELSLEARAQDYWRELGVSVRMRQPDLMLLKLSPRAAAKTIKRRKQSFRNDLLRGYFPFHPMRCLHARFDPDKWYRFSRGLSQFPGDILRMRPYQDSDGYGKDFRVGLPSSFLRYRSIPTDVESCREQCEHLAEEIFQLLNLSRRFVPAKIRKGDEVVSTQGWWRKGLTRISTCDSERHYCVRGFREYTDGYPETISAMLPYLHGVERYYCRTPGPTNEYCRKGTMLKFCRFLRREARAIGVKIPKPPD